MSRHFEAIGFEVDGREGLKKLAHEAVRLGRVYRASRPGWPAATFHWDLGRGLSVWVTAGSTDGGEPAEITACLPAFLPQESVRLRAYRLLKDPAGGGEVLLKGLLGDGTRLAAVLTNLGLRPDLRPTGVDLDLHLAALAVEAELFEEGEAPRLVVERPDGGSEPAESALLSLDGLGHHRLLGRIEARREVLNFLSGAWLWALGVRTPGGLVPTLVPVKSLPRPPRVGDPFMGTVWLAGTLPFPMEDS